MARGPLRLAFNGRRQSHTQIPEVLQQKLHREEGPGRSIQLRDGDDPGDDASGISNPMRYNPDRLTVPAELNRGGTVRGP